jgi:hypothetical protein
VIVQKYQQHHDSSSHKLKENAHTFVTKNMARLYLFVKKWKTHFTIWGAMLLLLIILFLISNYEVGKRESAKRYIAIAPASQPTVGPTHAPIKQTVLGAVAVNPSGPTPTPGIVPKLQSVTGWITYTSSERQTSFRYPNAWTIAGPLFDLWGFDSIRIQSPDGSITVTWDSYVTGLAGQCDSSTPLGQYGACSQVSVMSKTPISGAPGLYVVAGTITTDGTVYKPYLAVQDSNGAVFTTQETIPYEIYSTDNNGSGNTEFFVAGPGGSGPDLDQADADAWFSLPYVQQAQQILSSLTY